jgi:hypothetical protein
MVPYALLQGEQLPALSHFAGKQATAHCANVQLAKVEANAAAPAVLTARESHDAPSWHSGVQS